jgi:hypothetical protein
MPKPVRTRSVSTAQVRAYAGKAQEFADAAVAEITAGRCMPPPASRSMPQSTQPMQCAGHVSASAPPAKLTSRCSVSYEPQAPTESPWRKNCVDCFP